jgi:hypothetical protein
VQATDKIQSIAAFINERKREAENVSKTLEISNKITGNDKVRALSSWATSGTNATKPRN